MGKDASTVKQEIEQTRERMGDTVEALGYKADVTARVRDGMQSQVESVKGTIGTMVDSVKTAVSGTAQSANSGMHSAAHGAEGGLGTFTNSVRDAIPDLDIAGRTQQAVGIAKENPIGLAFVGLAVGFLTGSLFPVSDIENQKLGPIRDAAVDQAQAVTKDLVNAGKAVVADTVGSVLSSAQNHGQEVVDHAKTRIHNG